MPNTITTPNMGLVLPVPGLDPGPEWASLILAALQLVDAHDQSPGKGVKVTPAGLNINANLDLQALASLTGLLTLAFPLAQTDPGAGSMVLFTSGNGELGWYDNDSNRTLLTLGGKLNVPDRGVSIKAADYTILDTDSAEFWAIDCSAAVRAITLPVASHRPGRRLVIIDQKNAAGTHNITVQRQGADTIQGSASVVLAVNSAKCIVFSDGSNWLREA